MSDLGKVCLKFVCGKPCVNLTYICLSALREKLTQRTPHGAVSALCLLLKCSELFGC